MALDFWIHGLLKIVNSGISRVYESNVGISSGYIQKQLQDKL